MKSENLILQCRTGITVENGGLFMSRGRGSHPRRILESFELICVRSGLLRLREESRPIAVRPGEALLLWPHRIHQGIGRFPPGLEFYWVHFRLNTTAPGDDEVGDLNVRQHVKLQNPDRMEEIFRLFLDVQESGRMDALQASAYILLLLKEMRMGQRASRVVKDDVTRPAARAREYVKVHFHEPIHSRMVAQHLKLNPDYLGRLYKQAYGVTLTESIRQQRLKQARALLMHSDANVNEIASECGFDSSSYFRRLFKQIEGMSPTHWRKLHGRLHVNTA